MAIMSFNEWKAAKAAGTLKQKPSMPTKATEGKQLVSDSALQKSESAMPKKTLKQLREGLKGVHAELKSANLVKKAVIQKGAR